MYDFLVVGAGLSGATFARSITDAGFTCAVIDKRNHVAGNAYTYQVEDFYVHSYGPHIFHTDNESVWRFVNRFAYFNSYTHMPIARYNGKVYNLPFNMNTFYQMFGVTTPITSKIVIDREIESAGITEITNLEEQAISMVGTTIYNTLVKGYTEKQWGKPCTELPPDVIKRLPVRYTYDNRYFNDKYQGIPTHGYTDMVKNMLCLSDVMLGEDFIVKRSEYSQIARHIVYTGPIDEFFDYKFGELEYRSLAFEHIRADRSDNEQGCSVVNYTDVNVPYTRSIEHKHFVTSDSPVTVITHEYSTPWNKGDEPYYPIGDSKNIDLYNKYKKEAEKLDGVTFLGRLGTYSYMDMDDVIWQSMKAAGDFITKLKLHRR